MKWTLLILLAFISGNNPKEIARINALKKQAEEAFLNDNFEAASNYYHTLIDSLGANDDELYLNLAHSYYKQGDSAQARTYYSQASTTDNNAIKSIAYQQLGVMAKEGKQYEESLDYLKSSIKTNPTNKDARYDFELVKKLLEEQQKNQQQNQDQENQDQENQDQENQDQEDKDQQKENQEGEKQEQENQEQQEQQQNQQDQQNQEEGEEQEQQQQEGEEQSEEQDPQDMSTQEKLEQMNISEEKARMILEAMKNSEIQYLQQQKRKATKRPETGKPDW